MRAILGDPKVCPHGNPFPGCEEVTRQWIPLTELPLAEVVTIRRLHEAAEDNPEILQFLIANGILPGASTQVVDRLPFNQTLTLLMDERPVTLGFSVARYVFVERQTNPTA